MEHLQGLSERGSWECLKQLGWSDNHLAERLGVHRNTVFNWRSEGRVPRYAAEYIRVCWLALHILSDDERTDGFYIALVPEDEKP